MDSKKILAIVAVVIIALGAVVAAVIISQNSQKDDLSVVYLQKNGYETQMVAESKDFFGDYGLNVKGETITGSGQDAVNKLLAGTVDIAATGHGPVANTFIKYPDDLVILCGVNHYTGGQVWVTNVDAIVAYDPALDNKTAVRDSFDTASSHGADPIKFGLQQGATTESEFKKWLKAMGMENDYADFGESATGKYIELVNYKANQLVSNLQTGIIDGMAASQPYPMKALELDGVKKIGSNADVGSYDLAMYITTKKIYDEKKDLLERFIKALDKTSKYMADPANLEECKKICNDVINNKDAVDGGFATGVWKMDWSDAMATTLQKTCKSKGSDTITVEMCKEKCPFLELIASLDS